MKLIDLEKICIYENPLRESFVAITFPVILNDDCIDLRKAEAESLSEDWSLMRYSIYTPEKRRLAEIHMNIDKLIC